MAAIEVEKIDGRRARGLRTRDAIISALLDLIAGGDIAPTAQRIADRAGVSVRSVYQHFADVEGLYADAAARTYQWVRQTAEDVDQSQSLEQRIDAFVTNRTATLEALLPFSRAVRLIEPSSDTIRQYRVAIEKWARDRVAKVFATELRAMGSAQRTAVHGVIDTMTSTEAWEHLRSGGQTPRNARLVVRTGIAGVLSK